MKQSWPNLSLLHTFLALKTHFIKFFSDSTPPRQQSSAFGLPPPAADVICEWPLTGIDSHFETVMDSTLANYYEKVDWGEGVDEDMIDFH